MLRRFGHTLVFLAMFSIAGGHWAVLQSVAWTGMIIGYSKTTPLAAAVRKTLSGEDPCSMCRSIEAGKQKESRLPAMVKADKKMDQFYARPVRGVQPPRETRFSYPPIADEAAADRHASPPAPVPIAA